MNEQISKIVNLYLFSGPSSEEGTSEKNAPVSIGCEGCPKIIKPTYTKCIKTETVDLRYNGEHDIHCNLPSHRKLNGPGISQSLSNL